MKNFELPPNQEVEKNYNFQEIAEMEASVIELVKRMKEKIENGFYDVLVSDDTGGRIPTLIFRGIMKKVNPNEKLKTIFVASGKTYFPENDNQNYGIMQEHLQHSLGDAKNLLLTTQFIFSGGTLIKMIEALDDAGYNHLDVLAVSSPSGFEYDNYLRGIMGDKGELFLGDYIGGWKMHEEHGDIDGVRKTKDFSPFPRRTKDAIAVDGRVLSHEEWKEFFDVEVGEPIESVLQKTRDPKKISEWEEKKRIPLSQEEIDEIQRNVVKARKDVSLLVDRVVEEVWGNK